MVRSEVFTNPRLKLRGPYMVPSRVVSNPREKEPFPSEKTFLKTKGPYMVPSEQITKTRQKSPNVKGLKGKNTSCAQIGALFKRFPAIPLSWILLFMSLS